MVRQQGQKPIRSLMPNLEGKQEMWIWPYTLNPKPQKTLNPKLGEELNAQGAPAQTGEEPSNSGLPQRFGDSSSGSSEADLNSDP